MEKINISPDWVFSPQPMYIIGTSAVTEIKDFEQRREP